jgi:hypothetical protein
MIGFQFIFGQPEKKFQETALKICLKLPKKQFLSSKGAK